MTIIVYKEKKIVSYWRGENFFFLDTGLELFMVEISIKDIQIVWAKFDQNYKVWL